MEGTILFVLLSLIFVAIAYQLFRSKASHKNLPPGPPSVPILGHLHLLKSHPHRCFQKISQRYGPIATFNFGAQRAVIVSSSSAAEECLSKNDIVLANRPPNTYMGKYLHYGNTTLIMTSYGDHWRNLRRIGAIEIFSTHRLNMFLNIRKDEIKRLLKKLSHESRHSFATVEMKSLLSDLTFNVIMRMVAGKRYYGEDEDDVTLKEEAKEFKQLIAEISSKGLENADNFVPVLRWLNGGKSEERVKVLGERMDKFLQGLVDEQRNRKVDATNTTMINHLLSLQETDPQYYNDQIIKGLIMVMIQAGTDTSAVTMEWAMSNLMNNPNVLSKAKQEIDAQIGQERLIEESDLSHLHYLNNILSETLRLYPAAPLLLPHYSTDNCTINGYDVGRDTLVLINAWAIHRDPALWEDPESFKPERFDSEEEDDRRRLMPFGLGRRACPGSSLAQRITGLTLGALIQCFEWKRIDEKFVDMREGTGTIMPKAQPLEVMLKARSIMDHVLTNVAL